MRLIQVMLLLKKEVLGKGSYITIQKTDIIGEIQVEMSTFVWNQDEHIDLQGVTGSIRILLNQNIYFDSEIRINRKLFSLDKHHLILEGQMDLMFFDQNVVDIFFDWSVASKIHWSKLSNECKRSWLVACLYFGGLPQKLLMKDNFVIDANRISSEEDFFCLLGEEFCGSRGYFGQDWEGMNDCLNMTKSHEPKSITFSAFDNLPKILGTHFVEIMLGLFKKYNFSISTEN